AGNLFVEATANSDPLLKVSFAGNSTRDNIPNTNIYRYVKAEINNSPFIDQRFVQMDAAVLPNTNKIPLTLLNTTNTSFRFSIYNTNEFDRVAVGFVSLTYPRK